MLNHRAKLYFFILLALGAVRPLHAQASIDQLLPLVETSAHRLAIAEQVAFAKWDTGTPVEDAPREVLVIQNAVKAGESKGLNTTLVTDFFRAQIEANKIIQYSLLADWRRAGRAPAHQPVSLTNVIRPQLDQVQTEFITELAATADIRKSSTCLTDVSKAVGRYVATHHLGALQAIALDRAMAATCATL